jgi:hypothetical protein
MGKSLGGGAGRSGELGGGGDGVPVVGAGEEDAGIEPAGYGGGELVGPGDAGGWLRAGAGAVVFREEGGLFVGGLAPVVPAFGADVRGEFCIDVDDASVT